MEALNSQSEAKKIWKVYIWACWKWKTDKPPPDFFLSLMPVPKSIHLWQHKTTRIWKIGSVEPVLLIMHSQMLCSFTQELSPTRVMVTLTDTRSMMTKYWHLSHHTHGLSTQPQLSKLRGCYSLIYNHWALVTLSIPYCGECSYVFNWVYK